MKLRYLLMLLYASHAGWAQAEIYKYVDADGHVTYSSSPRRGAKKLNVEAPHSKPSPESPRARARDKSSPSDFPRVDNSTQKSRDNTRRRILEEELASEQGLLADARKNMKDAEDNPVMGRDLSGRVFRNTSAQDERIQSLQKLVTLHEKNVAALKTELSGLK